MRIGETKRVVAQVKCPLNCMDAEVAAFCCFVRQGDEVETKGLEGRARRARALVFLYVDRALVGVAALKRPDKGYRDEVFALAGVPQKGAVYRLELGWVFVPEEHRGKHYSRVLAAAALTETHGGSAFATTGASNKPMQRTLKRVGFSRLGGPWRSSRRRCDLVLYVLPRRR